MRVSMPVRAFLDSDDTSAACWDTAPIVSMPVRAFLDSDRYHCKPLHHNGCSFNARQGIS